MHGTEHLRISAGPCPLDKIDSWFASENWARGRLGEPRQLKGENGETLEYLGTRGNFPEGWCHFFNITHERLELSEYMMIRGRRLVRVGAKGKWDALREKYPERMVQASDEAIADGREGKVLTFYRCSGSITLFPARLLEPAWVFYTEEPASARGVLPEAVSARRDAGKGPLAAIPRAH